MSEYWPNHKTGSVNMRHTGKYLVTTGQRISSMFNNHVLADIIFILKSDQTLMAHKVILASASHVFHQLFNSSVNTCGLKVSQEDNMTYIELKDTPIDHLWPVVRYMYTDDMVTGVTDDNVVSVYFWSKQLAVQPVTDHCLTHLLSSINGDNCLKWWTAIEKTINDHQLKDECLRLIAANAGTVLKSKDIIGLSLDQLTALLDRNDLDAQELDLFNAAVRWAQHECISRFLATNDQNVREVLGAAFAKIRFPVMSATDFGHVVDEHKNLFTADELCSLIPYINSGVLPQQPLPFNAARRVPVIHLRSLSPLTLDTNSTKYSCYHSVNCRCCPPVPQYNTYRPPYGYPVYPIPEPLGYYPYPMSPPLYSPPMIGYNTLSPNTAPRSYRALTITNPKTGKNVDIKELAADPKSANVQPAVYTKIKQSVRKNRNQAKDQSPNSLLDTVVSELMVDIDENNLIHMSGDEYSSDNQ